MTAIERKNLAKKANAILDAMSDEELIALVRKYEKELNIPTLIASDNEQEMVLSFPDKTMIRCRWVNGKVFDDHCNGCALQKHCNLFHLNFESVLCSCDIRQDEQSGHWELIDNN